MLRILLVCLGTVAWSAELRVEVRDGSGAALVARATLENRDSGIRRAVSTLDNGTLRFADLPGGRYVLIVDHPGFASRSLSFELAADEKRNELFTLQPGTNTYSVDVVATAPLAGTERSRSEIPQATQAATANDLAASGALELTDFLNRRFSSVFLNEIQGNPFQPDLNFRGYTASPLLGTPQGLSVYLDGVRINQPLGEVLSWDLIPRTAIAEATLVPSSNPLFGQNTLGGSLALRTKDGFIGAGTSLSFLGGSFGRTMSEVEHGASTQSGWHWYGAGTLFFENGWRATSPSAVRQFFGKFGKQGRLQSLNLSLGYANNSLLGNGLQEQRFLERDFASVYTKPDQTANRAPWLNLQYRRALTPRWNFSANTYYRYLRTRTLNGDINEESLDQSLYQPNAAERAALTAAGFSGFPLAGENAANTPFPRWRCIANILLRDEPGEKCNGLLNRTGGIQRNYGVGGQANWYNARHQLTLGAAFDGSSLDFLQSTELGYLNPDRTVTPLGVFADGVNAGDADGEPLDNRVNLRGRVRNLGFYATDTIRLHSDLFLTVSGRYNHTRIDNLDILNPRPGTGSLTGLHNFQRFNPALGLTYRLLPALQSYFNYSEASRAPSSIELGCADPASPCRLPNALAGDPPLQQVVTRSLEAGLRSPGESRFRWSGGWFRADNRNDILFVASEQTGFGYFKNFGRTLRQGVELDSQLRWGRLSLGGSYTFLDATFQSPEEVNGTGNSTNEDNLDGVPGQEGTIEISPGNRIPLTPRHLLKSYADLQATSRLSLHLGVVGVSSMFARGNENNAHRPDGRYYLGPGETPAYAVANLGAVYRFAKRWQLFTQVNNLFDRRYYSAAQLGPTGSFPCSRLPSSRRGRRAPRGPVCG